MPNEKIIVRIEHPLFWKMLFLAVVLNFLSIRFSANFTAALCIIAVEIGLLSWCFITQQYTKYLCYFLTIVSSCMEFSEFAKDGVIYNLKTIKLAGINLAAILLLPVVFVGLLTFAGRGYGIQSKRELPQFWKFLKGLFIICLIAFFTGLICWLANDNNVDRVGGTFKELLIKTYGFAFLPLALCFLFLLILEFEKEKLNDITITLQAILIAASIQTVISLVFGFHTYYAGVTTLASVSAVFYAPCLLLGIAYNRDEVIYPYFTFIVVIIGCLINLRYNASGKSILVLGIVLVILLIKMSRSPRAITKILAFFLLIMLLVGVSIAVNFLISNSVLFHSKFYEASSLFQFGTGWLNRLPLSPRIRVGEFLNVVIEYGKKPWLLLTGKGFMGSIRNYSNLWSNSYMMSIGGGDAYPLEQYANNTFYDLHEITSYLITFGIMGVIFAIYVIRTCVTNARNNLWAWIGMVWFVLYFGYSFTLSIIGITALYYSLIDGDLRKINET